MTLIRRHWWIIAATVLAAVAIEWWMGRPPVGPDGRFDWVEGDIWSPGVLTRRSIHSNRQNITAELISMAPSFASVRGPEGGVCPPPSGPRSFCNPWLLATLQKPPHRFLHPADSPDSDAAPVLDGDATLGDSAIAR